MENKIMPRTAATAAAATRRLGVDNPGVTPVGTPCRSPFGAPGSAAEERVTAARTRLPTGTAAATAGAGDANGPCRGREHVLDLRKECYESIDRANMEMHPPSVALATCPTQIPPLAVSQTP